MHAICAHYSIKISSTRDSNYVAHQYFNEEGGHGSTAMQPWHPVSANDKHTSLLYTHQYPIRNRNEAVDCLAQYDNDAIFPEAFATEASMETADDEPTTTPAAHEASEEANEYHPDDPDGPFQNSSKELLSGMYMWIYIECLMRDDSYVFFFMNSNPQPASKGSKQVQGSTICYHSCI